MVRVSAPLQRSPRVGDASVTERARHARAELQEPIGSPGLTAIPDWTRRRRGIGHYANKLTGRPNHSKRPAANQDPLLVIGCTDAGVHGSDWRGGARGPRGVVGATAARGQREERGRGSASERLLGAQMLLNRARILPGVPVANEERTD
ncbi:hypothetical protein chiPu_0014161 [Chiloscyllium punctatum]|uniref:Uncharacterized protein n=1 Tax=Chiloscyllium punctatum TaxID=137246 RepID=A0A401SZ43_CHIPU|nr:hypothetical protein [Chiloscyllium punctatum]